MTSLWGREPALVLAFIQTLLALAVGFGFDLTAEQIALILAFSAAAIGLITRSQVTPVRTVQ